MRQYQLQNKPQDFELKWKHSTIKKNLRFRQYVCVDIMWYGSHNLHISFRFYLCSFNISKWLIEQIRKAYFCCDLKIAQLKRNSYESHVWVRHITTRWHRGCTMEIINKYEYTREYTIVSNDKEFADDKVCVHTCTHTGGVGGGVKPPP